MKLTSYKHLVFALALALGMAGSAPATQKDVVDTAKETGSFQMLIAALEASGLDQTLRGKGPFTIFAPNDAAFAKLPAGRVEELMRPENRSKLEALLKYHVVPGKVLSKDVTRLSSAKTVQGQHLKILAAGRLIVDNARVLQADIESSNGVIHVIDAVLLPN